MAHTTGLSNFRALSALLRGPQLPGRMGIERLDESQLERLITELESGRYRISPANWFRVRQRLYEMQLQEYGNRQLRDARTADENRFEEDNAPIAPSLRRYTKTIGYVMGLEDGRLARRIDQHRAIPFCGVQGPVWLSEAEQAQDAVSRVRWITGPVQCSRCEGYHRSEVTSTQDVLETKQPSASSQPECASEIQCPHCRGTSLTFLRDGLVLIAHCLCGWEGLTSLLGLDADVVAQNTRAVLAAPVRECEDEEEVRIAPMEWESERTERGSVDEEDGGQWDESEAGDLMQELVGMTDGMEHPADTTDSNHSISGTETDEDLDQVDTMMTREMVQFWASSQHVALRRRLLDVTMCGHLAPSSQSTGEDVDPKVQTCSRERLSMVWMVAATLTAGCHRMTSMQQDEFVAWLVRSADEELRQFLPEGAEEVGLPNVYAKIRSWSRICRQRLARFRSRSAGVRILAPSFGVSEQAFATAVALVA
ncbi:MAG: hypothetical protein OJF50_006638 [Nitrospira sp.]|nr:hypothetical protein [Nitrospira sp.]